MSKQPDRISLTELRKIAAHPDFKAAAKRVADSLGIPPLPPMPDGVPTTFAEGLLHKGPCAVPMWSGDHWRYLVMLDGAPISDSRRDGELVMFATYEEAIAQVTGYADYRRLMSAAKGE